MKFKVAANTDIGIFRKTNQDAVCIKIAETELGNVLMAVVCDGMGGLAEGEVASASLIYELNTWFETILPEELEKNNIRAISDSCQQVIEKMNTAILEYSRAHRTSTGTTVTCMVIFQKEYCILHAGDSRVYLVQPGMKPLTTDHTVVAREMAAGRMTEEEAKRSPKRSTLTRCIGVGAHLELEVLYGTVNAGELYMLCTDGMRHRLTVEEFYQRLTDKKISDERAMTRVCLELAETVKERGEKDNLSIALVKIE